jgi:hypothetical protein
MSLLVYVPYIPPVRSECCHRDLTTNNPIDLLIGLGIGIVLMAFICLAIYLILKLDAVISNYQAVRKSKKLCKCNRLSFNLSTGRAECYNCGEVKQYEF